VNASNQRVGGRTATRTAAAGLALTGALAGCTAQAPPADLAAALPPLMVVEPVAPDPQAAEPVRVRIPVAEVDAAVGPLFLDGNGVLPPPGSYHTTGWWHDGPEPGEAGPAVIAGHVDTGTGPAVFVHLDQVAPGDPIYVDRADGSTAVFVAQRTEQHPKDSFPTQAVYGGTPDSQLRLITCGGDFDGSVAGYRDNVIVYATRTAG